MNIEETKEAISVMQAFVDGNEVEYQISDGTWWDALTPSWNWASTRYRIKPTPLRYARELERELNAANSIIRQQQLLDEENLRLQHRIKRLEEALNGTVKWIVDLAESGDAGFWDADTFPEVIAARAALNTKKVKP